MNPHVPRLSQIREQSAFVVFLDIGTTPRPTTTWAAALARHYGLEVDAGRHLMAVQFDAQRDASASQVPLLGKSNGAGSPAWASAIPGQVPDTDSLFELEREGRLYFVRPGWITTEGQTAQDAGTGGHPRRARALFECLKPRIEKAIVDACRAFLDYERQQAKLVGSTREPDGGVLTVILTFGTLGGFGPGVRHAITRLVAEIAGRLKVNIKLVSLTLALGTIEPPNPDQAALNEEALLRYTQASLVADLDYAEDGRVPTQHVAESHVFLTNQNHHGEIPTLSRLQAMVGHVKFHMACTAVGRILTERVVDIEDSEQVDEYGGPRGISTVGFSMVHLDAERLLGYAGFRALDVLCSGLLAEPDPKPVRQAVLRTARELHVVETPDEALASSHLARLEAFEGTELHERLLGAFGARLEGLGAFDVGREAPLAYRFCLTRELAENLMPSVRQTARQVCKAALASVRQEVGDYLTRAPGIRRAERFLTDFRLVLERSMQVNSEISRAVAEGLRPLLETLGDTEEQIEAHSQRPAIVRALMPFTTHRLARTYRFAAEAALRSQAEIELRRALNQDLLRLLLAAVSQELDRIHAVVARLEAAQGLAQAGMKEQAVLPAERLVPVGLELVNPEFLNRRPAGLLNALGGGYLLTSVLFASYRQRFGSYPGASEADGEATAAALLPLCQEPFIQSVKAMDVVSTFREEFPDPAKQRQLLEQLVREAAGRLVVTGEAGRPVNWIKIAGLSDPAAAEDLCARLREADSEPGEWLTADLGDRYTLVLLMYRSGISLDGLIQQLRRRYNRAGSLPPSCGPDPITWILPSVRPDAAELARTIVRGLACARIRREEEMFSSVDAGEPEIVLGRDAAEAQRQLAHSFQARVRLTVGFVRDVVSHRDDVLGQLSRLKEALTEGTDEGLGQLIDLEAIRAVEQEVEELWPHLKRLPSNMMR